VEEPTAESSLFPPKKTAAARMTTTTPPPTHFQLTSLVLGRAGGEIAAALVESPGL